MEQIDGFCIEKHAGPYAKWPRRTRLFFDGKYTGARIPGFAIEGQYQCQQGFLLVTSQDCPFEESNDFILLSPRFRQIASGGLLVPYGSFLLNAHWPVADNALMLHYYETLFYELSIQCRVFGLGHRLALRNVKDPHNDPKSLASILELQERLRRIGTGSDLKSNRTLADQDQ